MDNTLPNNSSESSQPLASTEGNSSTKPSSLSGDEKLEATLVRTRPTVDSSSAIADKPEPAANDSSSTAAASAAWSEVSFSEAERRQDVFNNDEMEESSFPGAYRSPADAAAASGGVGVVNSVASVRDDQAEEQDEADEYDDGDDEEFDDDDDEYDADEDDDDEYDEDEDDEEELSWWQEIPTSRRMLISSTVIIVVGLIAGLFGLFYIDTMNGKTGEGGLLSGALSAFGQYSGERVFQGRERMNILCLGIDYNHDDRGISYTTGARSDTIFVVSIDPKGKTLNVLSIPRDSQVFIDEEHGYDKINSAYEIGGIKLAKQVVADFLGVPIHHYAIIKVPGAKGLVDALGGLTVNVEKNMDYDDNWGGLHIHLQKGEQLLHGEQAVGYARFRMDAESDRGRMRRQQQVMAAVLRRLKDPMVVLRLQSIVKAVKESVDTDFSVLDMMDLTYLYKDFDLKQMKTGCIEGEDADINGVSYIIPFQAENEKIIMELLKNPSDLNRQDVRIEVLNGTSDDGAAGRAAEQLRKEGFQVVRVANAKSPYEYTCIQDHLGSGAVRSALKNMFLDCDYQVDEHPTTGKNIDITIIIGNDCLDNLRSSGSGRSYVPPTNGVVEEESPRHYEDSGSAYDASPSYPESDGVLNGHDNYPTNEPAPAPEPAAPPEPAVEVYETPAESYTEPNGEPEAPYPEAVPEGVESGVAPAETGGSAADEPAY